MQLVEQLESGTMKRLRKQGSFLLGIHQAELANDPSSYATESSRSNLMAVQNTIKQMYGEVVARDVANFTLVEF